MGLQPARLDKREGETTLIYFATDNAGNAEAPHTLTIKVDKTPPSLTVPQSPTVQYSDPLTFNVSAQDNLTPTDALRFSATGLPSGLTFADNLNGTATVSGKALVQAATYPVAISVTDLAGLVTTKPVSIIVSKEDAQLAYTGDTLLKAGSPVTLSATVTEPPDGSPGDITKRPSSSTSPLA